ncbi:RagB/SusD family nutrient uptake outer membrane protein [Mucilaginibacter sp. 21P]|uniref:RagB/SusD family nutrient uptake outer membrane protein n=1 Tax=Mucilaginibacter sp. 21P TaxID=2778902 RepID=UPI001C59A374|nr:RagB/SusD family nutrient uptake outer membrane protein [Mucilaginibacter sp. 21P]QXV66844.1 RagB/SusD family nutrient uptake outer membrane protein [Mucilaginibacter sp. 21P]
MKKHLLLLIAAASMIAGGCKKYLDEKPDRSLVVISATADLQALLDNYSTMNNADPGSGEASADNYYLTDADWASIASEPQRRLYTWEKDQVIALTSNDWSNAYRTVYSCNTVLENADRVADPNNNYETANIKGQAYYYRGKALLQSALLWCLAYRSSTSPTDLGLPLRMTTDFNTEVPRSNNAQTFAAITTDLIQAAKQLPVTQASAYRPGKAAAFALLARCYLYTHNYDLAGKYADSALQIKKDLLDFNTLSASATYPIARQNKEVLHQSIMVLPQLISATKAKIDSNLYRSYASNDLRRTIFFRDNRNGTYAFKGSYDGSAAFFSGVAVDEVYLTRAECYARGGKITEAMADLNTLLVNRYKKGAFIPLQAATATDALRFVLVERRKELLMRGIRWMDIKRLNTEGANIALQRKLNGANYLLPPNDLRYAIAIPENLMRFGIEQNPR